VAGFGLDQTRRARAIRIDLSLAANTHDSDKDGRPDWWEDQNAFDKFDPTDAANWTEAPTVPAAQDDLQIQTFAEWRAVWFPNITGDLETFGQEDPDQDGVPNILEYAFGLNPTVADSTADSLPRIANSAGRKGIAFRKRPGATDLDYQV